MADKISRDKFEVEFGQDSEGTGNCQMTFSVPLSFLILSLLSLITHHSSLPMSPILLSFAIIRTDF